MDNQNFEVQIRNANGDVEYNKCSSQTNMDLYISKPFIGVVATNKFNSLNDIDIVAMYVKNRDPNAYSDTAYLEEERLKLLMKK